MQWALEHPILTFILAVLVISAVGNTATNYYRYKLLKISQKDVDKHK
jgi:hypothetical protein